VGRCLIAIESEDPAAWQVCERALATLGTIVRWADADANEVDALIFDLGDDLSAGVGGYAAIRRDHGGLPILLLARGLATTLAVELIRLGANDLLADAPTEPVVTRKVRRMLGGDQAPSLDHASLTPFEAPQDKGEERRRGFRAPATEVAPARLRLRFRPREVEAAVLNTSLETDGFPGAMLVRFPGDSVDPKVFEREERVASSAALLTLPDGGEPVDLSVLPVRVRVAPTGRTVDVAFQYRPLDLDHASRIARYWIQCQARARD